MPHLEIIDATGQYYRLDTLDMSKVGPWLEEWVLRLAQPSAAYPPLRVTVWFLHDDQGQPDMPIGRFDASVSDGEAFIKALKMALLANEIEKP